jgi:hypothetical protein
MESKTTYSETIKGKVRTYFLDVKKSSKGYPYLQITESRKNQEGDFEKVRLMVFQDDFQVLIESLGKAGEQLNKEEKPATTA